ncbi:hypothetical protein [Flavicella sp.]|uniref:hypothetical protein n=1 Tax=Flavicella sp. TaxID=2957742 RepID=UPI003017433A
MRLIKLLSVLIAVVSVSCASEDEKMVKYLTGNWETVYLKFELPTYQNRDTLVVYDIDFANPDDPRAQQRGKSFTTYNSDGTFKSWAEKNNLPFGRRTEGKWRATKDSLFWDFEQRSGKVLTVSFGLKQIENGYAITGLQDVDNDGKKDDTVYLETVRLPDTLE